MLGPGAWGTALAKLAVEGGHHVTMWGSAERLAAIRAAGENTDYLPDIKLPESFQFEHNISRATADSEGIILAVPSRSFREVATQLTGNELSLIHI